MNKKLTYPLFVTVLFIWGWIFYKLFAATEDNYTPPKNAQQTPKRELKAHALNIANYEINGHYRDPFMDEVDAEPAIVEEEVVLENNNPPPQEEIFVDWSQIKYLGEISGIAKNRKVALLQINGQDRMMKDGETTDGVNLIRHTANEIMIKYQGKTNTIQKNGDNIPNQ